MRTSSLAVVLCLSMLSASAARAGEPYLRPFKLIAERNAHNAAALDPAEQLTLGEFRLYKKNGVLPARVDPNMIYVAKVKQVQANVEKLKQSVATLKRLPSGNGKAVLDAVAQPHLDVAAVLTSINEAMRYVHGRSVSADLRALMAPAREAAKIAGETSTYTVSGGASAVQAADVLATAASTSSTAISVLNRIGTDHDALLRLGK